MGDIASGQLRPYWGGAEAKHYSYGPDFEVIPAYTFRIQPSRSETKCPLCGKPVDTRGQHAVIHERYDGKLVAGCYAHVWCCPRGAEPNE